MRSLRHISLLALLLALLVPASAYAIPGSTGFSGPKGGTVGSGGGGGKVFMNDVEGVNAGYRLNFRTSWHDAVMDTAKCVGRVCTSSAATWRPPSMNQSQPGAGSADGNFAPNKAAGSEVAWWNRCKVAANPLNSSDNDCELNASGVKGPGSWGEVHVDAPMRDPLNNPIGPYMSGGAAPLMGAPTQVSIRIWRECRITGNDYGSVGTPTHLEPEVNGSGNRCAVDPIYERTIPHSDHGTDQQTYFWARRADGKNGFTGSWTNSAFHALGSDRTGGALFGNCVSGARDADYKERCDTAGGYNGTSDDYYNKSCESGGLGTQVKWSKNEILAELAYLTSSTYNKDRKSRTYWRQKKNAVRAWADGSRKNLPGSLGKDKFCRTFSEWVAVDWQVPGHDAGERTRVDVNLNAIPGRLYGVQVVITDSRENIIQQSFQFLTGSAQSTTNGSCPPGDPNCDLDEETPTPIPAAAPPAPNDLAVAFPRSAIAGTRAVGTVDVKPQTAAPADTDGLAEDEAKRHSAWLPRSLSYGVFNRDDHGSSALGSLKLYSDNHQNPVIRGGGNPFAMSGAGTARKPAHPRASNGSAADQANPELDHVGSGAQYWSAFAPLLRTDTTQLHSELEMAVMNPTRTLANPFVNVGGVSRPNYGGKATTDDVRNATLLGEAKYASFGDVNATKRYRWERLTMDKCSDGISTRFPLLNGSACNATAGLGHGWSVRDAYYVPRTAADDKTTGEVSVDALFSQDAQGEARIILEGVDTTRVRRIEVWDQKRYLNRAPTDTPDYYIDESRAPAAGGEIRFCKATIPVWVDPPPQTQTHFVGYNVPAWHRNWPADRVVRPIDVQTGSLPDPSVHKSFYDETRFDGAPGFEADTKFYAYTGPTKTVNGKLINTHHLVPAEGRQPPAAFGGQWVYWWGRSWWDHTAQTEGANANNVGRSDLKYWWTTTTDEPGRWEAKPNPECMGYPNGANKNANDPEAVFNGGWPDGLEPGQYVVRYIITPGPAFHWGVRARLMTNDTARWSVKYDLQNRQNFLQVFRTRTAG